MVSHFRKYLSFTSWPKRFFAKAASSYVEFHAQAEFKVRFVAIIGTVGFPSFYWIWGYLFPQDYENFTLRFIGMIGCAILSLCRYFPSRLIRFVPVYSYCLFLYCLPFFFTFMTLMNGANEVWQLSLMAAFIYMALIYDLVNVIIVSILGSALGLLGYIWVEGSGTIPQDYFVIIPIILFTLCGILFLNYSDDIITKEKMNTASALAGQIAHEVRTSLLGVRLDAQRAGELLPYLIKGYEWAEHCGWKDGLIAKRQKKGLKSSMVRIQEHSKSANLVIDMLLMNAGYQHTTIEDFTKLSMRSIISEALERYYFKPGEREKITVDETGDFFFEGSDILMIHVILNLLRNGLRASDIREQGEVRVQLVAGPEFNQMIISDNGSGVAPEMINRIFIPFFSGGTKKEGSGIGLAFCRHVVESYGGTIVCRSEFGRGTDFIVSFPKFLEDDELDIPDEPHL